LDARKSDRKEKKVAKESDHLPKEKKEKNSEKYDPFEGKDPTKGNCVM
jgi:hypothetical protein